MAYQFQQFDNIPLAAGYDMLGHREKSDYHFSGRLHTDDSWTSDHPMVVYFHGSGGGSHTASESPLVSPLLDLGYAVFTFMYFDSGTSTATPWGSQYGSVSAPMYHQRAIRNAWQVQAAIEFIRSQGLNQDLILSGQSQGAISVITWSTYAGRVSGFYGPSQVAAIFANGYLAGGGSGSGWNGLDRNISLTTQMLQRVRNRTIACWARNDGFCPPDFHRRIQATLPKNPDSDIYVVSPGNVSGGHSWMPNAPGVWSAWIDQLYKNQPIIVNGEPAVPGV